MKRSAAALATSLKWLKRTAKSPGESSIPLLATDPLSTPKLVPCPEELPNNPPDDQVSQAEVDFVVVNSSDLVPDFEENPEMFENESNIRDGLSQIASPGPTPHKPLPNMVLPIRLLQTPATGKDDGVSLESLIQFKDLIETFQFNFSIQADYFLHHLHPDAKVKVTFVSGTNLLQDRVEPIDDKLIKKYHIRSLVAPLPDRFGTHHSKMMVNFFADDSVELIIMTANLTMLDFGGLTQMCWRSGRLYKGVSTGQGSVFQTDLLRYLRCYKLSEINRLTRILKEYNFSPIDVELLASAPGKYNAKMSESDETYGCLKLRQILSRNGLLIDDKEGDKKMLLAQVSSIASPYKSAKKITASIFLHVICPLMFRKSQSDESGPNDMVPEFRPLAAGPELCKDHQKKFNYEPHIVFPTTTNIGETTFGWSGGQAIHFKRLTDATNHQYLQNIKPYLCKWKSLSRQNAPPHSKIYMCANEDWKSLDWVLMCSHNLSKQAWGYPMENGEYKIASYELGVLIPGRKSLVPQQYASQLDKIPIEIPFDLPPTKYNSRDEPWSYERLFGGNI